MLTMPAPLSNGPSEDECARLRAFLGWISVPGDTASLTPFQMDFSDGAGSRLAIHPYCGCDAHDCPWCSYYSRPEEWTGSAHAWLAIQKPWADLGYIAGIGAPRLRFTAPGIDIRIAWGRVLRPHTYTSALMVGVEGWTEALDTIEAFVRTHKDAMRAQRIGHHLEERAASDPNLAALLGAVKDTPARQALLAICRQQAALEDQLRDIAHKLTDAGVRLHHGDGTPMPVSCRLDIALARIQPKKKRA